MRKLKIGIKQSKKCLFGSVIAVLFSLLGIILYMVTTKNTNGEVSTLIVAVSVIGTLLSLVSILVFYLDGILSIVSAAVYLFSMLMFVSSQADSIGYAVEGITDIGYGIQTTLVIGTICYLLAVIGSCLAVFDKK